MIMGNEDYMPTVEMVARKIISRTRDKYGNLTKTFTMETYPTDIDCEEIIRDVTPEVADEIGDIIPSPLWDDAMNCVALRAAMQIEVSYYSEQINTNRSPYPQLKEEYERALKNLAEAVNNYTEEGGVQSASPSLNSFGSFPSSTVSPGFNTTW